MIGSSLSPPSMPAAAAAAAAVIIEAVEDRVVVSSVVRGGNELRTWELDCQKVDYIFNILIFKLLYFNILNYLNISSQGAETPNPTYGVLTQIKPSADPTTNQTLTPLAPNQIPNPHPALPQTLTARCPKPSRHWALPQTKPSRRAAPPQTLTAQGPAPNPHGALPLTLTGPYPKPSRRAAPNPHRALPLTLTGHSPHLDPEGRSSTKHIARRGRSRGGVCTVCWGAALAFRKYGHCGGSLRL